MIPLNEGYAAWKAAGLSMGIATRGCLVFLTVLALILIIFLSGVMAYTSPAESFSQAVWVEITAGLVIASAAPFFLILGALYKWQVPLCGVVASSGLGVLAYTTEKSLLQSFLIEASSGLLLLVALDLLLRKWIEGNIEAMKENRKELDEIPEDLLDEWDRFVNQ